jgi:hypothetical protein
MVWRQGHRIEFVCHGADQTQPLTCDGDDDAIFRSN